MADNDNYHTTRRSVLKGSALGAGALFGAAGMNTTARASTDTAPQAAPAVEEGDQYFLKLDGIVGEVSTDKWAGAIQISEFNWGDKRAAAPGKSTGKQPSEIALHFEAPFSQASPQLMLMAAEGKLIKTGELSVATSNDDLFYKVNFSDIIISSYQSGGAGSERPTESVSLSFGKVAFSFVGQTPEGKANVITTRWNFETEKV